MKTLEEKIKLYLQENEIYVTGIRTEISRMQVRIDQTLKDNDHLSRLLIQHKKETEKNENRD